MIYILIPVFNEEDHIQKLIEEICEALSGESFNIVIVDDGSLDQTANIVKNLDRKEVRIISHNINLSIGAVYQTGINNIIQEAEDNDILVLMEADLTCPPPMIKTIKSAIVEQNLDVVVASRFSKQGEYKNFPIMRTLYSLSCNYMMQFLFPIKHARDYTMFFRGYRVALLKKVFSYFGLYNCLQTRGFVSNTELLIKCSLFTEKIGEIPFTYDYIVKQNRSKLRVFRTIIEYFGFIFYMQDLINKFRSRNKR
jgi:dolichol-phosphate mannosyltransferase